MLTIRRIVIAVCFLGMLSVPAAAQCTMAGGHQMQKALYARLGGIDVIKAVVGDFADRVLADARVNKKFAKSDAARLVLHLEEQICAATGGPGEYTGNNMKSTHKRMKVTG